MVRLTLAARQPLRVAPGAPAHRQTKEMTFDAGTVRVVYLEERRQVVVITVMWTNHFSRSPEDTHAIDV
jgi:hypothetical protein